MKSNLIIPTGTQIVTLIETKRGADVALRPRGSVGVVVAAPADDSHRYRVRFPDETEAMLHRREMSIRKYHQGLDYAGSLLDDFDLDEYIIYRCVVGSRAYGLEDDESDTDRRGIYLPPPEFKAQVRELALGVEGLERFVRREPLRRIHECVFGVLALESDPVDPRL